MRCAQDLPRDSYGDGRTRPAGRFDYMAAGGPAYCRGIVHHRNGDTDIAQTLGRNTVKYLERYKPERVVALALPERLLLVQYRM